jgi:amino acid adenylation domain-containing protein
MEREELRQESAIITDQEAEKLLHEWNRTKIDYPRDKCVHHLFEEQVMRSPDSIAVVYEHEHATYAELNAKANRLAHYLVKKGVKEESIVAVFLERGIDMLVGLLAISKVGATYLPLDPIYPKVRIEMVLNDARPVLCLTQRSLIDHLPQSEAKLVLIDDKEKYAGESTDNLPYGKPLTPLYIIFTSGSTGKPKGVPVTQRSTVNLINCFTRLLQVTTKDIILMVTTITFDIAESDIYLALLNGGKLVIATRETSMNMELLKEKLETSKATIFEATPITHKMLIQAGWKGKKDLKLVSGGDEMSRELGAELVKRVKEVFNVYGPTETTIYNTYKRVVPEDAEGEGCVPLGRPVDNNQLYILDTELKLVPVGIPGELYIGGDGLSPGYLNNPEMTASRFVKNPFSEKPDDLIFKSGDLVKYLPDSTIVFLARIDTQVKIRGFRIELGEIESTICSYPGIKEAIVVAPENPSGEKVLVAYYTLESSEDIDLENLRSLLKSKLPDYLVPSFFSKLDKIPLTLTNKVDRRTLTATGLPTVVDDSNFVAPSTDNEILLAKIWEDILKVDRIGIHSGFFELGGHSLLATQLITRIKNEFNVEIPFGKIFEHLTIAGLLSYFDEQSTTVQKKEKPPIPRQSSGRDEFPLSSSQRRIWFMENYNPGIKAYNNPLDYKITGDLDIKVLQRTH